LKQDKATKDIAALAKGGRTNFLGFLLRLAARMPFLFIAGRLYGAEALGRFASALVFIDLAAQLCTLGQKRGLAQRLAEEDRPAAHHIADGMVLSVLIAVVVSALLYFLPVVMFPSGQYTGIDRLLVLAIIPTTLTDIALAALAYRFDVASTVRSRSVVEPWSLSIAAGVAYYLAPVSGLAIAYLVSIYASALVALVPLWRSFGWASGWWPSMRRTFRLGAISVPLAVADMVEWGTRRLDIAILGLFAPATTVGIYYVAQQIASLPQKLKTSFEPILGPVITRNLKAKNYAGVASQVCQVGFWITAAQAGIALALGIPGQGVMGLVGPKFVEGTEAMCFLLAAEVFASTAVVSEAALIYIAPLRNMLISLATIALQTVLTVIGMHVANGLELDEIGRGSSAAGALLATLGLAAVVKSRVLGRYLQHPVNTWRWPLAGAVAIAGGVGGAAVYYMADWADVAFGVLGILGLYCWIIWRWGFGPADRVLFRKDAGGGK
jgi:O-antigen/teichoic acid export membrane protein